MKATLVGLFAAVCGLLIFPTSAFAQSGVVISQLQTGDSLAATNEAVELYNNSETDVDVTDWCLRYTTATSQTLQSSPKYCFAPIDLQTKIFLSANSYASIVTSSYSMPSGTSPDGRFAGSGMAASGGHVRLLDADGLTRDLLGW